MAMVGWRGVADYIQFLFRMNSGAGGAIVAGDMPNCVASSRRWLEHISVLG